MGACKLLSYLWKAIYGRPFLFSGVIRKYNRSSSRYGLEIKYGGNTMRNESKQTKPDCPLIGENGNYAD